MSRFYVGQKVVCVDDSKQELADKLLSNKLIKDKIYTVLGIGGACPCAAQTGLFVGILSGVVGHLTACGHEIQVGDNIPCRASRFVPLEDYYLSEVAVEKLLKEVDESLKVKV